MANIKSQLKRIKTNEKARLRNKAVKSSLKTSVRKFREAADAGDARHRDRRCSRTPRAQLDKAASKGVIHTQPGRQPQVGDGQAGRLALSAPATAASPTGVTPSRVGALRRLAGVGQPVVGRGRTIATTARSRA